VLSGAGNPWGLNISMKTSDFHSQFARDRALRVSRTKTSAPTNAPPIPLGDETNYAADGATSGIPMGYTHTRGVRMHIKVTQGSDDQDTPSDAFTPDSSPDFKPQKKAKLVDKTAGPVLALMSVPVSKGNPKA
jgi:hypothetical protein